jgi:hypothetical protein
MKLDYETPPPDVHPRPLLAAFVCGFATCLFLCFALFAQDIFSRAAMAAFGGVGVWATIVCARGWSRIRAATQQDKDDAESLR